MIFTAKLLIICEIHVGRGSVFRAGWRGKLQNGVWGLLVFVFHVALIFFGQVGHDGVIAGFHGLVDVGNALALRHDGFVDDEAHAVEIDEIEAGHAGQHVERAIDGDGDNGQLEFVGQLEGAFAEEAHVASEGARPFREHHEGGAVLECVAGVVDGFLDFLRTGFVDEDVVGSLAGIANQEDAAQGFLHHPFEVTAQEAVDEEDVHRTLVVGYKNVALMAVDVFASFNLDGEQEDAADKDRPQFAWVVAPEMCAANEAADDGGESCQDGCNQAQGEGDAQLVDSV